MNTTAVWDETTLIQQAQDGQLDAFNELVLHYQNQVYNLAYHLLHDGPSADDVAQETFISAYKALSRFRGGSFRAWLSRITSNACYDEMRRRKRKPTVSWDDFGEMDEEANPHLISDDIQPEQSAQQMELRAMLERAIAKLPPDQQTVLVLVDQMGFAYDEVAETMNIRLGTVKSRLARARKRMQKLLQEERELLPHKYRLEDS